MKTIDIEQIHIIPSSNISQMWYCKKYAVLLVEFHNKLAENRGAVYAYKNVPKSYINLFNEEVNKLSGSIGKIFNATIRANRQHPYVLLINQQETIYDGWTNLRDKIKADKLSDTIIKFSGKEDK